MKENSGFHLFQLPNDVLEKVLRRMDWIELILFSLCSIHSKQAVCNLHLSTNKITIPFISEDFIQVYFGFIGFSEEIRLTLQISPEPGNIKVLAFSLEQLCRGNALESSDVMDGTMMFLEEWIQHFQLIFHHPKIDHLGLDSRCEVFDLALVNKIFQRVQFLELKKLNPELLAKILKTLDHPKSIYLQGNSFKTPESSQILLSQRFLSLNLNADFCNWSKFKIDELTLINSRYVKLQGLKGVTEKDLNRFLRLWRTGENPFLEFMEMKLEMGRTMDKSLILKGLEHKEHPQDKVREHKNCYGLPSGFTFQGGCDIERKDGSRMTLFVRNIWMLPVVRFFVWPRKL